MKPYLIRYSSGWAATCCAAFLLVLSCASPSREEAGSDRPAVETHANGVEHGEVSEFGEEIPPAEAQWPTSLQTNVATEQDVLTFVGLEWVESDSGKSYLVRGLVRNTSAETVGPLKLMAEGRSAGPWGRVRIEREFESHGLLGSGMEWGFEFQVHRKYTISAGAEAYHYYPVHLKIRLQEGEWVTKKGKVPGPRGKGTRKGRYRCVEPTGRVYEFTTGIEGDLPDTGL